jgi:hypothetical protein
VTQANTAAAQDSSDTSARLKSQADRLNDLVSELTILVNGTDLLKDYNHPVKESAHRPSSHVGNLVAFKRTQKAKSDFPERELKKAAGQDFEKTPKANDPRFEDV